MTDNEREEILEAIRLPLRIERDWTWKEWPEEDEPVDGPLEGFFIFIPD